MKNLVGLFAASTTLLATTACGGSPEPAAATDQPVVAAGQPGPPGANGEVAAMSGRTVQVQSPMSGQVAVTWNDATTFTAQVAADAGAVQVGDCVMVDGEGADTIAATAVRLTPASDGSCAPVLRGGPPMESRSLPEGAAPPSGMPTGAPPGGALMMGGAFGKVTAVSGTGFTVETTMPGATETSSREVTTTAATTYTDVVASSGSALKVGKCVNAQGEKDDTGAITATSIAVSDKVDGACGFGGGVQRFEASS